MFENSALAIRDCFIVPYTPEKRYYLFSTSVPEVWQAGPSGFDVYIGNDLSHWEGPLPAFRPPPNFWANRHFWAPEVHLYQGRYHLFASFGAEGAHHGTQIMIADHPGGPYQIHSPGTVTPRDWECLDGSLFVEADGQPWMAFVHEWSQLRDGAICATRLSADLTRAEGEPVVLFHASDAPFVKTLPKPDHYVTDGPFVYRATNGELLMLWSSFKRRTYVQLVARSLSGHITGPWRQDDELLYEDNGGHGMLFHTFEGQLMLALHRPNRRPLERPLFLPVREVAGRLAVVG